MKKLGEKQGVSETNKKKIIKNNKRGKMWKGKIYRKDKEKVKVIILSNQGDR